MVSADSSGAAGAAKLALSLSLNNLTNTFILSPASYSEHVLAEVPKTLNIDPLRQRRAHQKSKTGCENCRRRRVKCNEEIPCANCTRRQEICHRLGKHNGVISVPSSPSQTLLSSSGSTDAAVNLIHMKLFHHFQTSTHQTLLIPPDVWEKTFQLCFKFEYLMNAVLCVAARHLAFLLPEDTTYPTAASSHLCRSLSLFRHALSTHFTSIHIDAFIAMSFLLQYEIWASGDFPSSQAAGDDDDSVISFNPLRDRIFTFSSSMKEVFLKTLPLISDRASVFVPQIQNNPLPRLLETAQISNSTLFRFQDFFDYNRPITPESLNIPFPYTRGVDIASPNLWTPHTLGPPPNPDMIEDGYKPTIARLCVILSFLPEANPPDITQLQPSLMQDLAKYIMSFPVLCHGPFSAMVRDKDPHALLLLFHFYRAVRILLPERECWWAWKRVIVSEEVLRGFLGAENWGLVGR